MPRKPELEPRWLVGLLHQWAMRELYGSTKGLGYYSVNPMLKDGIPTPARSYEPTGYSDADFSEVGEALNRLSTMQKFSVLRYFAPWKRKAIDLEVSMSDPAWMAILRSTLVVISGSMDRAQIVA